MKVLFLITLCLWSFMADGQSCTQMAGKWTNEFGSVLVVDSIGIKGQLIGHYASSTGVDGKIFPLNGWVNKNEDHPDEINISFMVQWEGYGSITSWTGYCISDNEGSRIKTIWNLVRSGKDYDWERIITNSSTFVSEGK